MGLRSRLRAGGGTRAAEAIRLHGLFRCAGQTCEKSALVIRRFEASEKKISPTPCVPVVGGMVSIRLEAEDEFNGTGLAIHKISASAERKTLW